MARKARKKSTTGIYHVLIRAIADLSLFNDDEDTQFYASILNDLQQRGYCEVYAYALFPTHVHLLIREGVQSEPIGSIMKRLAAAYSYYFNVKYDHYGPIYLDRFKSQPIETRPFFLRVLDFIGSQPVPSKAVLSHHIPSTLSTPSTSSSTSSTQSPPSTPPILDFTPRPLRITDSRLLDYLKQNFGFTNVGEFLQRTQEEQKKIVAHCKHQGGSVRQLVRLTGMPFQQVFLAK